MIHSWLSPQIQNLRYRGPTVKLYVDFQLCWCPQPLRCSRVSYASVCKVPVTWISCNPNLTIYINLKLLYFFPISKSSSPLLINLTAFSHLLLLGNPYRMPMHLCSQIAAAQKGLTCATAGHVCNESTKACVKIPLSHIPKATMLKVRVGLGYKQKWRWWPSLNLSAALCHLDPKGTL